VGATCIKLSMEFLGGRVMPLLWPREPATAAKHRLYKSYLDAWWPILLQPSANGYRRKRVTYVDAFAGPGRYEGGEPGSPILALQRLLDHVALERMGLSRDRVCLVFMEKRRDRCEHLRAELVRRFGPLPDLPVTVEVRHGEAGRDLELVLAELGSWGQPILAIFDSWGNVNVPFGLAARVARNPASEVIATFGPNWFNRRENENPEQLDLVFGGRRYWVPADRESRPDERWRAWLETYRETLGRAGWRYRLQFEVVPRTGQPLYLVFGTGHPKGVEVMKAAMWNVDVSDGMRFRDPRTRGAVPAGQDTLWDAAGEADPELAELVSQRLAEGPTTLEELGQWLLLETARWRAADARVAVSSMLTSGSVRITPPGRLLRSSVIRSL
jgi:three-Cys-motif partner protein